MVVVTNDYHAFRTALQARRLRIDTHAVGAPTARYFLPSAYLREFVAVLRQNWLLHAVVIAALALGVFGLLIISLSPLGFQPN